MHRPNVSGTQVGPYLLTSIAGPGRIGDVYRAVDTSSEGPDVYAMKRVSTRRLSDEMLMQLAKEVYHHFAVSGCDHVLPLRGIYETNSHFYYIFDLCETDISRVIWDTDLYWRNEPLIKTAFLEILDGVQALHNIGVAHRDLSLHNIMCNANGTGIQIRGFEMVCSELQCGESRGRSAYCASPEYWTLEEDEVETAQASDLWSLGVILFVMVTGHYPWSIATPPNEEYLAYIRDPEYFCREYEISESFSELLRRIMHPNPKRRARIPRIRQEVIKLKTFYKWYEDEDVKKPVVSPWDDMDIYFAEDWGHTFVTPPSFKDMISWTKRHLKRGARH